MLFPYNDLDYQEYKYDRPITRASFVKTIQEKRPKLTEKDLFIDGKKQLTERGFVLLMMYLGIEHVWEIQLHACIREFPKELLDFFETPCVEMYFIIKKQAYFITSKFEKIAQIYNHHLTPHLISQMTKFNSMFVERDVFGHVSPYSNASATKIRQMLHKMHIYIHTSKDEKERPYKFFAEEGIQSENKLVETLLDEWFEERANFLHNNNSLLFEARPQKYAARTKRRQVLYDKDGKHVLQNFS